MLDDNIGEEQIAGLIHSWYNESKNWRQPLDDKIDRLYHKFRGWLTLDNTYAWQSQVFVPESFTAIWTALPSLVETMFSVQPYVAMEPLRSDAVEGAKYAESLITRQFDRIGLNHDQQGIYMLFLKWCQQILLYGNGYIEVPWVFREGTRKRRVPQYNEQPLMINMGGMPMMIPPDTLFMGYQNIEQQTTVYDDPDVIIHDWKAIYNDPYGVTVQRPSRYIIVRDTLSEAQVEHLSKEEGYKNLNKLKYGAAVTHEDDDRYDVDDLSSMMTASTGTKYAEILKCFYTLKINGKWKDYMTVVGDDNTVIMHQENPYHHGLRPIIKGSCFPLSNRFHDIGLLEPMEDLQDGTNHRYNQMADIITTIVNPMLKVSNPLYKSLWDRYQGNLPATPGLMIPINQGDIIEQVNTGNTANIRPAQEDIAYLKGQIESSTVTYAQMRGGMPQRKETATTVVSTMQKSDLRFRVMAKIMFYTAIKPLTHMMMELNHQFKVEPEVVKIKDAKGLEEYRKVMMYDIPHPEELFIRPNMTFIDPSLDKKQKAKDLAELLGFISASPEAGRLNWSVLFKTLFDYNDMANTDNFILSDEEFQQQQQEKMQLAMLQQSGKQGLPGAGNMSQGNPQQQIMQGLPPVNMGGF